VGYLALLRLSFKISDQFLLEEGGGLNQVFVCGVSAMRIHRGVKKDYFDFLVGCWTPNGNNRVERE
jgi:hypothetical protein